MKTIVTTTLFIVVSIFGPTIVAWAGAPTQTFQNREILLPHVCSAGPNAGDPCEVLFANGQVVDEQGSPCPGLCVIDYQGNTTFQAKVTIGVDDQSIPPSPQQTSMTVLVEVEKDGQVHFFADSFFGTLSAEYFPGYPVFERDPDPTDSISSLFDSAINETILQNRFLYVAPTASNVIAQGLRDLFGVTGNPVITDVVESYGFSRTVHTGVSDFLGSSLHFKAVIRFVNP